LKLSLKGLPAETSPARYYSANYLCKLTNKGDGCRLGEPPVDGFLR